MKPEEIQIIKDSLEPIAYATLLDLYDDWLNERFGVVTIAGYEYPTSRAFELVDREAYKRGLSDFTSDDRFTEIDGEYYYTREIEDLF